MAFSRPLLPLLVERIQEDMISRLDLDAPLLRRSLVYVLARVLAGAAHMLHGHLEYLSKQIFPDQCEAEYLVRWGALFGLSINPATWAQGDVDFTGTDSVLVPEGTYLVHADGRRYVTDEDITIGAVTTGIGSGTIIAVESGEDGNLAADAELTLESPIAGVDSIATVDANAISGGSDVETTEEFRVRVLDRMSYPPHGGNATDYVAWAKEVSGVTRAWCYPLEGGAGTVTVRFVRDNDDEAIPDAGEVSTVQAYIDALAPCTAVVTVAAPTDAPLNFTLSITPDTTATRAAVTAQLEDLILRTATPGGTTPLSQIETAIGTADGITDFTITAPAANVTRSTGQLTSMGAISWT